MSPKRLVPLVEGKGDMLAIPKLLGRLLHEREAFDAVFWMHIPWR